MRWLKQQLRRQIREKRSELTFTEKQQAAKRITKRLLQQPVYRKAQHIALYMSLDDEISTNLILRLALKQQKSCYLPVITPALSLEFVKVDNQTCLEKNCFGILEPTSRTKLIYPWQLDLVLTPLVAFDSTLHRLGMGGGYYDRTFAAGDMKKHMPYMLGLAYDLQRIYRLPHSDLDILLDMVITEKRCYNK
ncbi:MAG TPA: 5-formyltetrahydrofolate cyclo-ligase [Candidatus Berkiella sp.]|nr:5-formyltetrahydrofolate cyclo-ligase [Candidatus Berkiella sp.]